MSKYMNMAFTPAVKASQEAHGSREAYRRFDDSETNTLFTDKERDFITLRDSFYMATVSESGWPYLQHRGGPTGFVQVFDDTRFGFADFRGNRQYLSTGNLSADDRVSLFFMDYANRRRLKIFARASVSSEAPAWPFADYPAKIEQFFLFQLEAFEWNCPQHITPRFTADEIAQLV